MKKISALMGTLFSALVFVTAAQSEENQSQRLAELLRTQEIAQILHQENIDALPETVQTYLGDRDVSDVLAKARAFYDPLETADKVVEVFATDINPEFMAAAIDFYGSDLGKKVVELETSARQAIATTEVEEAAIAIAQQAQADQDPRIDVLIQGISDFGLVDLNVQGANGSFFAFLSEIATVENMEMSQGEIFGFIAEGRQELEMSIREWLLGFSFMAYSPLSDEELETYFAFGRSEVGQAVTLALFDAFLSQDIQASRNLGQLLAQELSSQDL